MFNIINRCRQAFGVQTFSKIAISKGFPIPIE